MQTTHKLSPRTLALLALFVIGLAVWQLPGFSSAALAYSHAAVKVARAAIGRVMGKEQALPSNDNSRAAQAASPRYKVTGASSLPSTFTSPFATGITVGTNVNVSQRPGGDAEATICINPFNPSQLVALSNIDGATGLFKAFSTDGGATWTGTIIANGDALGMACCDAQTAGIFDEFGNFFMVYLTTVAAPPILVRTGISTNGGATITPLATLTAVSADQPSIAIGAGTVWVDYNVAGTIRARGATVTGLGTVGAFSAEQTATDSGTGISGNFGGIAIGPLGQVLVVYQNAGSGNGPDTIFANLDADGVGGAGFGARITVTGTNVGGFDVIPAQQNPPSIDAEAGLAWDRSGGPHHGRVYLVYTDENIDESNDTDIFVRFSDNNGATWSPRIRVNDDATTRSQFLPQIALDQTSGNLAVSWHDCRNDSGAGPGTTNAIANDDAQFFATFSTTYGASFLPNVKVSAGTSNAAAAASSTGYGDYTGLAFHAGRAFPIWADNSNSTNNNPNGALSRFDLYTAQLLLVGQDADLAVSKNAFVAAPVGGNPINAVIAGGTSNTLVSLTDANNPATNGPGNITYVLNFSNAGPAHAVNVRLEDFIPGIPSDIRNTGNVPIIGNATIGGVAVNLVLGATGTNTNFAIDCTVPGSQFAPGAKLICSPGDNTAMNPAFLTGVLPATFQGQMAYRLQVRPDAPAGAILANSALITSNAGNGAPATSDPNAGNNVSLTTNNSVITRADLGITKVSGNPTPVAGGAAFAYTLTVTNAGPSDAANVTVTDPLPAGIFLANSNIAPVAAPAGSSAFACSGPPIGQNGTISCTSGSMAAGATATFTLTVQAFADLAGGVRTNTATVTSATTDPGPPPSLGNCDDASTGENADCALVTIANNASLSITKTAPATACAGDTLNYDIAVTNSGNSSGVNVVVTDTPPANTSFVSVTGANAFTGNCSYNPNTNTVTCTAGFLPTGTHHINLVVKTSPSTPTGALTNSATLAAAVGTITGTNPAVGTTTINHCADLSLTKTAPGALGAGTTIDYVLKLKNNGPSDITGGVAPGVITIMDTLPAQVATLVSVTVGPGQPGGFTCTSAGTPIKITCVNAAGAAGNFPVGAVTTITIKVKISPSAGPGTNIENCAMISAPTPTSFPQIDPNTSNNTSCASSVVSEILTVADLSVSKAATPVVDPDGAGPLMPVALPIVGPNVPPGSVNAGGYLRYDVPFGNNGPADAVNVMLSNVVPGNTAFVGALATGGVFVPAAQPPVVPFTFTIQAVDTVAPLGPPVNLTCTVINAAGGQQIFCRPQGNTGLVPPYADGTLPADYSGQLTFFVKVNESVTGGTIVSDPAIIASGLCPNPTPPSFPPVPCVDTPDPNTANNVSQVTQNVVIASSNLTISKIVQSAVTSASNPNQTGPIGPATPANGAVTTGTAVLPGTLLTYRITLTNNGPSDVSNIRLTDVLPSGLETPPGRVLGVRFVVVNLLLPSGATFTCAPPAGVNPSNNPQGNGGSLVCTAPLLSANAPNNVAAIDITVFIDPATKANLVNVATFDATINNFNRPISGTTVLTTPVAATSDLALAKTHTNAAGVVGGPVTAGTTFTYTITATNNGPSAAQMFNLVDTFPLFQKVTKIEIGRLDGNGQFVTPNAKDGNGNPNVTCTTVPALGSPGNTTSMTCTASELPPNKNPDGTVNPAGTVVIRLTVNQDSLTPQPTPTSYQNCVTATSMSTDPNPANNTNVCDTVNIIFSADVAAVSKLDAPDPVIAGNQLTYTITATNNGPSAALNEMISDPLPVGTVFVAATPSAGGVADVGNPAVGANGTVKFTWPGLTDVGVVRTLTIIVRVCPDFQQILNLTDAQMCVPNLTDTATFNTATSDPNPANNTASATTTVQAQSDLAISKSGPAQAPFSISGSPSNITYTLSFSNAGPSNSSGTMIVDVLPKGLTVVGTPTSTVPGTTFVITTTDGVTTVKATLGVLGAANQCQLTSPTSGTITIVANVPIKHPLLSVTNSATISTMNCLPDPNLANNTATFNTAIVPQGNDPGLGYPALAEVSDQKAGSILFFNSYTSDAANTNRQNARISLTNVSGSERVCVHLFAVDGANCAVLDVFVCLTPNQTTSFLASDFDPGSSGYLMAVAVNCNNGLPRAFNCLIGDEYVKFATGHQANLAAESIAATMVFPGGTNPTVTTTTLKFDGLSYNRLPYVLAADNLPSPGDDNSTLLIVNRVGGNFTLSGALIGGLNGLLFNDTENLFSFTANQPSCQLRALLSNNFPRAFTPFTRVIPAGRTGWMKFWGVADSFGSEKALFGAQINFNPTAATSAGAFNQGHNLHKLTLTNAVVLTIPIFPPNC